MNFVTPLHRRTSRDYVARMVDDKVTCMLKAKEYELDYWDGDRRFGYGGYRYDSRHGLADAPEPIRPHLHLRRAQDPLPWPDDYFDLAISLGALHNLRLPELQPALGEVDRVARAKYVMVESYRNEQEQFNLQCWALTAESFFDSDEWIWLYDHFGFTGDYEFIYFES